MRLVVVIGLMASMATITLGLFITGSRGGSEEAKQERDNRMVKDFQPFSHPANKYKSPDSTNEVSFSGPIANIQWIGDMLLPIFGPLGILPKPVNSTDETKEGFKPSLLILGFTIVVGGFVARKYGGGEKEKENSDKIKNENERSQLEECASKIVTKKIEIDSREDIGKKLISRMHIEDKKLVLEDGENAITCKKEAQKDLKVVKYVSDIMKASTTKVDKRASDSKLEESTEKELPNKEVTYSLKSLPSDLVQELMQSSSESAISSSEGTLTPSEISDDTSTITQETINKLEGIILPSEELITITKKLVNHSEPLENSITLTKERVSPKRGSVTLQEEILTLSEETAALLEETIAPFSDKLIEVTKSDKGSKNQLSKENQFAKNEELEERNYTGPLKSFRITKYPKTRAADLNLSLNEDYIIVSMVVQLQSTAKMKAGMKAEEADVCIEGANISNLKITEVKEKDELELTSKTMTIKAIEEMSMIIEDMDQVMKSIEKLEIQNVFCESDTTKQPYSMTTSLWDNNDVCNSSSQQQSVNLGTSDETLHPCLQNMSSISEEMKLQLRKMEELIKEILKDVPN